MIGRPSQVKEYTYLASHPERSQSCEMIRKPSGVPMPYSSRRLPSAITTLSPSTMITGEPRLWAVAEKRGNAVHHAINSLPGHERVKRQREDFTGHLFGDRKFATPAILEQRKPMTRLPVNTGIDAPAGEKSPQVIALLLGDANVIQK